MNAASFRWLAADFDGFATTTTCTLTAYLMFVAPVLARRSLRQLGRARVHDQEAMTRFYRRATAASLILTVIALLPLSTTGVRASNLGLATPSGPYVGPAVGLAIGFVTVSGLSSWLARRRLVDGDPRRSHSDAAALIPGNRRERHLATLFVIAAGAQEEVVFRGLLIAASADILALAPFPAAAVALAAFAVDHLYRGWRGVTGVLLPGAVLTALYLLTASLLLPIVVHILVNVMALVLVPYFGRGPINEINMKDRTSEPLEPGLMD